MASINFHPLSDEDTARLKPVYIPVLEKGQTFIRTIPGNVMVPSAFQKFQHRYKTWKVQSDDVYVLTFAKNGTTSSLETECIVEVKFY